MRLFDFGWLKPEEPAPVVAPPAPEPPKRRTPEEIIDGNWTFGPIREDATGREWAAVDIRNFAAIHIARSLESIADDLSALREHFVPAKADASATTDDAVAGQPLVSTE